MIKTILYGLALILYYIGITKRPQKKEKDLFETLIIGTILLIILTGMGTVVCTFTKIRVDLWSIFGITLLLDIAVWLHVWLPRSLLYKAEAIYDRKVLLL